MRAFVASLVLAFVVLSVLSDRGAATQRVLTGTVAEVLAGEWMSVVNETTDPTGLQISLREATACAGREHGSVLDPAAITPGVRATVWYRSVAERRPAADNVRVLSP